ncbi:Rib/alpha-like domain-containing protein [Gardnerella greenwoodii]|uniref:Rib/alpha-like domain-containing protein n=1 Tax=Gardnerella greenwoodii TaxID=2914925 RepID=UPI0039F042E5
MSDLHRNSRFLRFLRSIRSKTTCVRRAIVALFVAIATVLATFMIMPSASMGASQQSETKQVQTQNGNAENKTAADNKAPAKGGAGVKNESAAQDEADANSKAEESKTVEHKNPQPSAKQGGSDAPSAQNVDTAKQPNNSVEGAKKNLNKDAAERAKKEESANKSNRQKRSAKEDDRAAGGESMVPEACRKIGITELAKCYVADYNFTDAKGRKKQKIKISKAGESHTVEPEFHRVTAINKRNGKPTIDKTDVSDSVKGLIDSFSLERLSIDDTALESNNVTNDFVKVNPTSGEITIHPNKWLNKGSYYVFVKVKYKDNSTFTHTEYCTNSCKSLYNKSLRFNIQYGGSVNNSLSLKVYNHQDSTNRTEVDETNGVTFTSDKDGKFSKITTPIFIDSQSSGESYPIYHRMVCHKDGDGTKDSDYYLNSINGLTLNDSADGASSSAKSSTQKQWSHTFGNRPTEKSADDISASTVYEDDTFAERSQSWITGTPKEAGTFICKVLALKDIRVSFTGDKHGSHTFVSVFDRKINESSSASSDGTKTLKQNLFDKNINVDYIFRAHSKQNNDVAGSFDNPYGIFESGTYKRGEVWDVKTIKIEVKSNKKQNLVVGENDLKLNVYPFEGSTTALSSSNNDIYAMLGMELKPSIEATSVADSQKEITLKMLCAKGEKPKENKASNKKAEVNAASTTNVNSAGSYDTTGNADNTGLEYTKWEEPSKLGFSFPDGEAQKPCTSEKDKQTCSLEGKNFAATTKASATFKSAEAGDYKCVVYALKPEALDKFNTEVAKTGVTPSAISAAFAAANLTANKNLAKLAINIHVPEDFTLPHTGEWNWNLQLGAIAAVMVSVLAAGFVASQSDSYRKLFYERRRC